MMGDINKVLATSVAQGGLYYYLLPNNLAIRPPIGGGEALMVVPSWSVGVVSGLVGSSFSDLVSESLLDVRNSKERSERIDAMILNSVVCGSVSALLLPMFNKDVYASIGSPSFTYVAGLGAVAEYAALMASAYMMM